GNALHVNDLVDYVSESGEIAGSSAARFSLGKPDRPCHLPVIPQGDIQYVVPQKLDIAAGGQAVLYFRSARTIANASLEISAGGQVLLQKKYKAVRPPEMERIVLDLALLPPGTEELSLNLRG
ncbi:MAG TPA: pyridine nucleotide-disulfide oxidoreductase, partial [Firmicutes bacterium]|nr:pyridine nucleotide-disulfide oxidoreductase [Bacillota bacterium]